MFRKWLFFEYCLRLIEASDERRGGLRLRLMVGLGGFDVDEGRRGEVVKGWGVKEVFFFGCGVVGRILAAAGGVFKGTWRWRRRWVLFFPFWCCFFVLLLLVVWVWIMVEM